MNAHVKHDARATVFLASVTLAMAATAIPATRSYAETTAFWPLPPSGSTYWWMYDWHKGPFSGCSGSDPKKVGIAAGRLNDQAFHNDTGLISFSFFKDDACAYWGPGKDEILRWYSRGYQPSQLAAVPGSFLSFRGDSRWLVDRTGATQFVQGGLILDSVNGRYTASLGGTFPFDGGTRYQWSNGLADSQFPSYAVLPDAMRTGDVVVSRDPGRRVPSNLAVAPVYCSYLGQNPTDAQRQQAWANERNTPDACTPVNAGFAIFMRSTTYRYQGHAVQYVGYSEWAEDASGPRANGAGACEEWWYAQDVGPIAVVSYRGALLDAASAGNPRTCKQQLTAFNGGNVSADPFVTIRQAASTANQIGRLELISNDWCASPGASCQVLY